MEQAEPAANIRTAAEAVAEIQVLLGNISKMNAQISRLQVALNDQVRKANAVVAYSTPVEINSGNREHTPTSSLTEERAEQIARLVEATNPGTSLCTVMPTGSMKPFFDEKAILLVEHAKFEDLRVGDIVTYRHPQLGVPVSHRLVEQDGDKFWVKGDANGRVDNVYVTRENYISRVFAVIYSSGN